MPNTPETWLDEFTVNTVTTTQQFTSRITQLATGNILIVWASEATSGAGSPAGSDVIGQIFSPLGVPIGNEFLVNFSHSTDDESRPDIAALPGGGFIAIYEDHDSNGATSIRLNEFDSLGAHVSDSTTVINDPASGTPEYSEAKVAVSSATSALIIYNLYDGTTHETVGKIYNSTTNSYGAQFTIASGSDNFTDPDITTLINGNYVIVSYFSAADDAIAFKIIDSAGAGVTAPAAVANTLSNGISDVDPAVQALAGGGFVVGWHKSDLTDTDMQFQLYNSVGVAVGSAVSVDDTGSNDGHVDLEISALSDGGFAIVYYDIPDDDLKVARYNSSGTKIGSTYTISTAPSIFAAPAAVLLEDGRFAVTWSNDSGNISMEILDIRDDPNSTPVYSPDSWQVGTIHDDSFLAHAQIVHGGKGNDTITDAAGSNFLFGDDGDDRFFLAGIDALQFVHGGDGVDTVYQGFVNDGTVYDLQAELMTDTLSSVSEIIRDIENIVGGVANETILGDAKINLLRGGGGNDVLDGRGGSDSLFGDAGNDRITYDASDDLTNVKGGADTDTLVILGGSAPLSFDLAAHEFELAEHSFGIGGGAAQRDTYNTSWQRTDRTIYQADNSRSETHFDPLNLVNTVQVDDNFDSTGTYVSQTAFYDTGGRWAATFNLAGPFENIYNYFDDQNRLDYTTGLFDTGLIFLEDADQGNLHDWTSKYAVNTASNQPDYQYDTYDNGTRSYLDHDQNGVEIYLYQYTFYDASNVVDYYYGKYNNGDDYYVEL